MKSKTIDKIKKLLALGQSSNEAEAALALKMASKLMAEANISELDLALNEDDPVDMDLFYGKFDPKWKKNIGCFVAKLNYCKVVSTSTSVYLIGRESNKTIARSMYDYIIFCINTNGKAIRKAKGEKAFHSYAIGFMAAIMKKFSENDGWIGHDNALVVSTFDKELTAFLDEKFGKLKSQKTGSIGIKDQNSFNAGLAAGSSMSLNKQVISNAPVLT